MRIRYQNMRDVASVNSIENGTIGHPELLNTIKMDN